MGRSPPRALVLFWAGTTLGLALAIGSLAWPTAKPKPERAIPRTAVAVVNGVPILKSDYEAALRVVAQTQQRAPTLADKRAALQRLVDDELLIEHGIALGMVRADQPTRDALLSAVFTAERAPGQAQTPTEAELERFYGTIRSQLKRPGSLHVRQLLIRFAGRRDEPAARARAAQAVRRLRAGEPFERVRAELASPNQQDVIDQPLPFDVLSRRLGTIATQAVLRLEPGQVSDVLGSGTLLRVIQLVAKQPAEIPTLEQARAQVLARYREQVADQVFTARLATLRKQARISATDPPP